MDTWKPEHFPRGEGSVHLKIDGSVAEVQLDNPRRKGAISLGMMHDLGEIVSTLDARSDLCAVVITGTEKQFCAGGDLRAVRSHLLVPGAGAGMCEYMTGVLDRLADLPAVIVAAVDGVALGGGAELVSCADVVVAGADARLGFVHASLGLTPGWGGGRRLVQRVGNRQALNLLAFASVLSAEQAQNVGMIDTVVPSGTAREAAFTHVAPLRKLPVASVRASVAIARGSNEANHFAQLWGADAHQSALNRVRAGR